MVLPSALTANKPTKIPALRPGVERNSMEFMPTEEYPGLIAGIMLTARTDARLCKARLWQ
jgi:hypothetical protein